MSGLRRKEREGEGGGGRGDGGQGRRLSKGCTEEGKNTTKWRKEGKEGDKEK